MTKRLEKLSHFIRSALKCQVLNEQLFRLHLFIVQVSLIVEGSLVSFSFLKYFFFLLSFFSFSDGFCRETQLDCVVIEYKVLKALYSLLCGLLGWHLDEAVTTRLTSLWITNDRDCLNLTACISFRKNLAHLLLSRFKVQVLHKDLSRLLLLYIFLCFFFFWWSHFFFLILWSVCFYCLFDEAFWGVFQVDWVHEVYLMVSKVFKSCLCESLWCVLSDRQSVEWWQHEAFELAIPFKQFFQLRFLCCVGQVFNE